MTNFALSQTHLHKNVTEKSQIYQGNVCVYLQGNGALIPIGEPEHKHITYFIGSEDSNLIVRDHRCDSNEAANLALSGQDIYGFADIFNRSAFAEIFISANEYQTIEIDLYPVNNKDDYPVLWMGILDEKRIPPYIVEWEFLRPFNDTQIAFVILAK